MTNFEKYKDDLMKIEGCFAFNKNTKKITRCDGSIICEHCLFDTEHPCENSKIKWLCEEYEEPILSDDELELINTLSKISGKQYKYICRNGFSIFLFSKKPPIDRFGIRFTDRCNYLIITDHYGDKSLFLNIKYKDGLYDIENKCFIKK
jgi:hypothetical protein